MNLGKVVEALKATPLFVPGEWEELDVKDVFASDMISDILVSEGDNQLLLTSLTSPQVIRTAALLGIAAIIVVHRRQEPSALKDAAGNGDIPVFWTPMAKFEACVKVGKLMGL